MDCQVGPPALAPSWHAHADAACHYIAKAGRKQCEYCEIMTPGGYRPPSLRAEIGDFGSSVSCSFCPLSGFLFSCLGKTFFFAYAQENSPVQPLPPASLPTSSSNSVLPAMTLNSPTCLASGNTFHDPSGSTCAWTTLASNTLVKNTSSTSLLPFGQRGTTLSKILRAISIVVSLLLGTTTNDMLT